MQSRRSVIALIPTIGVPAPAPPMTCRAWAQPAQQTVSLVRSTAGRLVAIFNSPDLLPETSRKLQQVIDATVNVNDIAHFCLGRFWRLATPEQHRNRHYY
jgi:hypothetical protein